MKIEIDNEYIKWLHQNENKLNKEEITEYINEVLENHRQSWQELEEDELEIKCTHPNHVEGKSCEDYAVGCHKDCKCCMIETSIEKRNKELRKAALSGLTKKQKVKLQDEINNHEFFSKL